MYINLNNNHYNHYIRAYKFKKEQNDIKVTLLINVTKCH